MFGAFSQVEANGARGRMGAEALNQGMPMGSAARPSCTFELTVRGRPARSPRFCQLALVCRVLGQAVDLAVSAFLALPAIESSISACSLMRFRPFAGRADAAGSCAMLRRSASMVTVDACACSSARIREQRAGKTLIHFNLCPYAVDPFLQHRNRESLAVARRDGFLFMA